MKMKRVNKFLTYLFAILIFMWTIAPMAWLFISAISPHRELISSKMGWFPHSPTLSNFKDLFNFHQDIGKRFVYSLRNSLIVAGGVTLIGLVFGTMAAYALARFDFKGKNEIMIGMLLSRLLPSIALLIPFFVMVIYVSRIFNLYDTKLNLIIIYNSFILGFVIWIMKGYFETIPQELEEAALIDGCSPFEAFMKVILPISLPGLVATGIFTFLMAWDEFLFALVFTRTKNAMTVPMFIATVGSQYITDYEKIAAAGFIGGIIPVLIALLFQKYIVKGILAGSVKG